MLDERALARRVALVHRADLRHGDVRLVDDHEEVVGEVVEQAMRRLARRTAVDVPRVVLDARAEADLLHHLEVEGRAHAKPLRLQQLALAFEFGEPLLELDANRADRSLHDLGARDVVRTREDRHRVELLDDLPGQRVQAVERLDLVAEHLDADGELLVDRDDLDRVTAHTEVASREVDVVALVLHGDELADEPVAIDPLAHLERHHRSEVLFGRAEAVDARDGRNHDDVAPAEERVRGGVPQPLDLRVDRRVLLDEGVGLRYVGLGLVVVVVRDEVLDRVVRHELAELGCELRRERLVVGEHEGRSLHLLDEPRRGRGLARSGRAEQHHIGLAGVDAAGEFGDRGGLVAARSVLAQDLERANGSGGLHAFQSRFARRH